MIPQDNCEAIPEASGRAAMTCMYVRPTHLLYWRPFFCSVSATGYVSTAVTVILCAVCRINACLADWWP